MARLRVIAAVTIATTVALSIVASASPEAMKALGILEMRRPTAAPDVTLRTLTGPAIAMKDLRGKVVLVNFWATWCTPCQWEMPLMESLYQAYKARGFVILAISIDQGNADGVRAFVRDKKLTYPVALDPRHEAAQQFGITGLPATLLVGPDGYIRGVTYGPKQWDGKEARAVIESLLPRRSAGVAR
jgi:peroxiredoxin